MDAIEFRKVFTKEINSRINIENVKIKIRLLKKSESTTPFHTQSESVVMVMYNNRVFRVEIKPSILGFDNLILQSWVKLFGYKL